MIAPPGNSKLNTQNHALERSEGSKLPLGLLLLVLGVYILTMSGHTYSPDEETMLETSRALVTKGSWAMSPSHSLVQVPGVDGRMYSQYGPAQSLAAVPWVAAGLLVGNLFPKDQAGYPLRLILGTYNALIMAGLVALFAAMGLALGNSRRAVLFSAAILAFATFLWPHSRTFFSEPLVALALFASFYLLYIAASSDLKAQRTRPWLPLVASGALFALALATKVQYVVALPAFLLYLGWRFMDAGHRLSIPLSWLGGLVAGLVPLFLYNTLVFGSPLATGYGSNPGNTLTTPFLEGAFGLLLSPGKGLLWYAFPLVLTFLGWLPFAKKHRPESVLIIVLSVSILALFSVYSFWPGDGSWGPRYLTPAVPFLLLPILHVVQRALPTTPSLTQPSSVDERLANYRGSSVVGRRSSVVIFRIPHSAFRILVATVVALGFLSSLLGVLVNFDTYINVVNDDATRYYNVAASPIVGHLNLLEQRANEWYLHTFPPTGTTLFRSGFSYSEGDKSKGELLPRWTTGSGVLDVHPAAGGPLSMTLRLTDHRPPNLPRASLTILVNGNPVTPQAVPVKNQPISTDYSFTLDPRPASITIQTDTWNPSKYQDGGRNEELGLMLDSITLTQSGRPLPNALAEALPPPPYYPQPRWYYDPGTHHLADLWPAYLLDTNMSRKAMLAVALPVLAISFALIFLGLHFLGQSVIPKGTNKQ
jgi:hypothetical protein